MTVILPWLGFIPDQGVVCAEVVSSSQAGSNESETLKLTTPIDDCSIPGRARQRQLKLERKIFAQQLDENLLYDSDDVARATALLEDYPENSREDNISRMAEALAVVDPAFALLYNHYQKGDYTRAMLEGLNIIDSMGTGYANAVAHYMLAEACRQGQYVRFAVDMYADIITLMPDRISFAAQSTIRTMEIYCNASSAPPECAAAMARYCLRNYRSALASKEADQIIQLLSTLEQTPSAERARVTIVSIAENSKDNDENDGHSEELSDGLARLTAKDRQDLLALLRKTLDEKDLKAIRAYRRVRARQQLADEKQE